MVSGHDVEEFGFGRSDASEVRHDEPSEVVAQNFGVFEGALAGCPAGAVGDGDEVRMVGAQGFGRAEELFAALFILGREKFHGEKRAVLRDEVGDGPVGFHGQSRQIVLRRPFHPKENCFAKARRWTGWYGDG